MGFLSHLRRHPRVRLNTQVAVSAAGKVGLAFSSDCSEGGMGLSWHGDVPAIGSPIQVVFYLPTRPEPLTLKGVVIGGKKMPDGAARFGVGFDILDLEDRRALRRYVNTRRFLHGDLRAPSGHPQACQRMTDRLTRLRTSDGTMDDVMAYDD